MMGNCNTEHTLCGNGVAAANAGLRKFSECTTLLSPFESEQVNVGKHRSAAFFQDIVPGWSDYNFKWNFRIQSCNILLNAI